MSREYFGRINHNKEAYCKKIIWEKNDIKWWEKKKTNNNIT
jgi:hypothetical protein